nr:hypothetical protein [Tanacetum cinerariifolium]
MFDTSVLDDEKVVAEKEVSTADPVTTAGEVVTTVCVEVSITATTLIISMDDITLAKALAALKSAKPMVKEPSVRKAKGIVMQEPEEATIRTTLVPSKSLKDEGKAKMIEPKKPLNKKDHIMIDEEVVAEKEVSTADPVTKVGKVVATVGVKVSAVATTPIISKDDITLAKALAALKSAKSMVKEPSVPKAKGIVMQDPEETTIRTKTTVPSQSLKDKGKAKMIKPEKPLKKKDQIMIDEKVARNLKAQLQAELEEEERLARTKGKRSQHSLNC